jgi:putative component of membrane protein insertase Oxa1/YidC/SpoIIIJ protein YidD
MEIFKSAELFCKQVIEKSIHFKKNYKNVNELTFIFSAAFVIYKEVFSSQDIDACVFTPSCSVYAIESIKQQGVVVGFFSAIDRLTRCNPWPKKGVPIDLKTGKYWDPVEYVSQGRNFKRH